jgi:hypothetical protein
MTLKLIPPWPTLKISKEPFFKNPFIERTEPKI